jgi:hypothetical protein
MEYAHLASNIRECSAKESGMRGPMIIAAVSCGLAASAHSAVLAHKIESIGDPRLDGIPSNVAWNTRVLI